MSEENKQRQKQDAGVLRCARDDEGYWLFECIRWVHFGLLEWFGGLAPVEIHGVGVGPRSQFSERARMRADDVLPQPRGPENR